MSQKIWTDDESQMLFNLKKSGHSYSEIAKILKSAFGRRLYTNNSCKKKWNSTDWDTFISNKEVRTKTIEELKNLDIEKQKVIDATLANSERILKRENSRTQIIIDNIKSAIYRLPKPKQSDLTYTLPPKRKQYSSEDVGVIFSDLHIGEEFTLEDTGGLSEYNLSIFKRRLEKMKRSVLEITDRHRHMYDLPTLHIFCLGDIIGGAFGCGAWNDRYISLPIYDQLFHGEEALRNVIACWSGHFSKVKFYGIYGNHGRIGKKGQEKNSQNWDRICYDHVKTSMENYDNIEWNIPEAWWLQPTILGHNFYLCHGDGIRGTMGIPYYGVEKAESKIVGLMENRPDYILMGHFHSPAEIQTNTSRVIMNGCFTPDTNVWMSDGVLTPIKNIKVGFHVIGKDLKPTKINRISRRKYSGNVVCFRTVGNSHVVKCTPNHEMFSIKENILNNTPLECAVEGKYNPLKNNIDKFSPRFLQAEYLSVGDYVAQISNDNLSYDEEYEIDLSKRSIYDSELKWWDKRKIDKTMSRFLGYYLAEDSISGINQKSHWIDYSQLSDEILTKCGLNTRLLEHTSRVYGKAFCDGIVALCGKGSTIKRMDNNFVEDLPIPLQLEVLIGYLQRDGHSYKTTRRNESFSLIVAFVSRSLRDQMSYFAMNCGYIPHIREQEGNNHRKSLYWLIFRGDDAIDLSIKCEMPFDKEFSGHFSRNFIQCDRYIMRKISQCWTEHYEGDVFDLEVEEQESYNVEGLICHNSFMGGDMFSLKDLGRGGVPEQKMFGIHKKKGITWSYNIYLDGD